ncbi:hypothetical protein NEFER03_0667 [Nematocida sp. LUAm3]|nr:hypothetical protein NEFER03_0667 [Nematocida sp. LUAm3]KAI5175126.1 hypothetical protein NEFER02_1087 [Nematocida sp. LUAm2]KAI5178202.1 hypothetical protein NEFER01_1380 [Nematocida sp. LUAm1]
MPRPQNMKEEEDEIRKSLLGEESGDDCFEENGSADTECSSNGECNSDDEYEEVLASDENMSEEDNEEYDEEEEEEEEEDADEELLRIASLNKEKVKEDAKEDKKEDLMGVMRVLALLHKEGEVGKVNVDGFPFLGVFSNGLDSAACQLREQANVLFAQVEEEMSSPGWKRLNKQKPIKQRIKQSIAEKVRKMNEKYEDMPFILEATREFCYRTGMRIKAPRVHKPKKVHKIDMRVHEKVEQFYLTVSGYEWEDEKIDEFLKCIFAG